MSHNFKEMVKIVRFRLIKPLSYDWQIGIGSSFAAREVIVSTAKHTSPNINKSCS
jgi:hypothetical protein